jgi:type IV pilus assembly protein PilE
MMLSKLQARPGAHRSSQRGVTLIELMTVIVVLGILVSIAVPSYRRYLIRSQRTDAMTALLQLQTAEEKYYLQNNAYTSDVTGSVTASPPGLGLLENSAQGYYKMEVTLGTGSQSYTAKATPVVGKGQDSDKECNIFTLTDTGNKGVSSATGTAANCWK